MELLGPLFFLLFTVAVFALAIGGTVLWVLALIEVARFPEPVFRMAGTERVTWILVVALAQLIGAVIYWFAVRQKLKVADERFRREGWAAVPGWSPYPPAYGGHPNPGAPPPPSAPPPPTASPPPPPAPGRWG